MDLKVHVYRLHDDSPVSEELDEECDVSAANHWILPSSQCTNSMYAGIWYLPYRATVRDITDMMSP